MSGGIRVQARRAIRHPTQLRRAARHAVVSGVRELPRSAERAALVQLGVAAQTRERIVSTAHSVVELSTSRRSAQRQLEQLERRGARARSDMKRSVRQARTRVARWLRSPQRDAERERRRLRKQVAANRQRIQRELRMAERDAERRRTSPRAGVAARGIVRAGSPAGRAPAGGRTRVEAAASSEVPAGASRHADAGRGSVLAVRRY